MSAKVSARNGSSKSNCSSIKANAALLAAVAALFPLSRAHASSGTWTDTATGGLWSNTGNWASSIIADGSGNTADFSTLTMTANETVHMDASHTIGIVKFGDLGNTYNWTLDNNGTASNTLTLMDSAGTYGANDGPTGLPQINVSNGIATISANMNTGEVYQYDQWVKAGNGALVVSGVGTWGSGIVVTGGTVSSPSILSITNASTNAGSDAVGSNYYSYKDVVVGSVAGDVAILNQSAGIVSADTLQLGFNGAGTLNLSGTALMQAGTGVVASASQNDTGTITESGSSQLKILNSYNISAGHYYGRPTTVTLSGASSLAFYSDSAGSTLGGTGIYYIEGGTSTINLNGGTFSLPSFGWLPSTSGGGNGSGVLNFNGGTMQITSVTPGSASTYSDFLLNADGASVITANVQAGGATIDTYGNTVTIVNPLVHSGSSTDGGLTLNDSNTTAGTLTLAGTNTYTGSTTITRGTLALASTGSISSSNAIKIGSSGIFNTSALASPFTLLSTQPLSGVGTVAGSIVAPAGSITAGLNGVGGPLTFSNSLTLSGASTNFNLTASSSGADGSIIANGGLNITASTTVDAIFSVLPISSQTYTLFSYTGTALTSTQQSDLTLSLTGSAPGYTASQFSLNFSSGLVNLVYTPASGASSNLTWASTSSHLWDVATSSNWNKASLGSGANSVFNQGDNVTFDDTAGVQTAITLNTVVEPGAVTDTANSNSFNISGTGKISGTTNLTMSGGGTLTIGTSNDFTGTTFLTNGTIVAVNTAGSATGATGVAISSGATLKIGDNATTGAGIIAGTISDNGNLVLNRPDSFSLTQDVTGSGTLTQAGSGTSILSVAQGYSGPTNISAGTLQYGLTNALPYYTNLTLSGTGTLNTAGFGQTFDGVVTSGANTTISIGAGNLSFSTSSPDILQGAITGTTASSIYVSGTSAVTVSGNVSIGTLALANADADKAGLTIASGANISVSNLNVADGGSTGGSGTITQSGGTITASTVNLAGSSSVTNNAIATLNITGGAFNVSTGMQLSASQNSRSFISLSGTGAINLLGNSSITFGQYYGEPATINQTGGSVNFANGSIGGLVVSGEGTYTWNLSGGVAAIPRISWTGQAANNAYSVATGKFNFNGGTLRTTAANSAFFPANVVTSGNVSAQWITTVQTGGAIIDPYGNAVTFTNNMIHDSTLGSAVDGGLIVNDSATIPGVLTLSGSNTYTGNTNISRGTLALGSSGSINTSPFINVGPNGNFNVSAQSSYSPALNQVLGGNGTVTGPVNFTQGIITGGTNGSAGTLTFNNLLTLNGGTSLFDLAATSGGSNDLLVASGGLNVSGGSIIDAVFATAPSTSQTYVLFNYSAPALTTAEKSLLSLSTAGSASGVTTHNLSLSETGTQVLLTFTPGTGTAANLIWASTSSTAWDTSSVNWHNPSLSGTGANTNFFQADNVTFDDTAGVQTAITLNIAAQPGSVQITSNTNNFSFTGSGGISGTTGLNKTGTSTLTLGTNNSYSGVTNLSGGTTIALNPSGYATGITSTTIGTGAAFNIGNGSTTGAGNATGTIVNNGTLNLNRPDAFTFPASVSGNAFLQMGAGLTTLTGTSTYSGDTNITGGGLQLGVTNALPTGTNINITSSGTGVAFGAGSFNQSIGHFDDLSNNTLALGTGQLSILSDDNSTIAGPVTGSAGSVLYISSTDGSTTTVSNNVSAGTISVAPLNSDGGGGPAVLTISSGNITVSALNIADGNGTGGSGQINQNAGTVTAANVTLANTSSIPGNANATYDLNGGTLNVSSGILMSVSTGTDSVLSIGPGATLNMMGNSLITMGNYYGEPASIVQTGGTVAFANGSTGGLQVNGGGIYSYTLGGGELSIPRITFGGQAASASYGGATATFQFNGGVLQVTAAGQFFPSNVAVSGAKWITTVGSGGATVDTDGNAVLFTNNLATAGGTDGGLTKIGAGTLTLAGSNSYNGGTNVSVGSLVLATSASYPSATPLIVAASANFSLLNHGANSPVVPVMSTLSNSGTIDVTNNGFVVQTGTFNTINSQIKLAYNSGNWNGSSAASGIITSSTAAGDVTHLTAVGIATNLSTFEGAAVSPSNIEVKYTYYGDLNLDGIVDGTDYSVIDENYLTEQTTHSRISGWYNGDFNYDGVIDGSDYTLMDNAYNTQSSVLAAQIASPTDEIASVSAVTSSVPEPTTLGLLGIGVAGLLGRRRRR